MNRDRCFDCLAEIPPTARHFAVLKTLPLACKDDEAMRLMEHFGGMSQECVCEACAGWYQDDAIELPEGT